MTPSINEVLPKVACDKQARMGCKRKDKCWYGDKQPMSVDRQSEFINKIAIIPAYIIDGRALKQVCPNQAGICADKAYSTGQRSRQRLARLHT